MDNRQDAMEVDGTSSSSDVSSLEEDFEQFQDEEDFEDADLDDSEDEPEKDETEQELERLVFGDSAGFKQEIKSWRIGQGDNGTTQEVDNTLTGINDADLFFIDSGADKDLAPIHKYGQDLQGTTRDPPAWEDSDDDRLMVSLMSVPRLRKLRKFEGEDVISGREYQERLRQQFELLNPRPKWAQWAQEKQSRKRRRVSNGAELSDSDASDDLDNDLSAQPLAKLLRSNQSLVRGPEQTSHKRPKLRPEAIGIERMKDITPTQPSPITCISIHPKMPLLLSSGPSSTLYLHNLQPHPIPPDPANPLITSLHLKHTPLNTTAFSPPISDYSDTTNDAQPQIYLSGRRRYFHIWDLPTGTIRKITRLHGHASSQRSFEVLKPSPCGRYVAFLGTSKKASAGVVNIIDAKTTFWLAQAVVESMKGVADFVWWGDGEGMVIAGRGGECVEWSMSERKIITRWQDEGAVGVTTMAMGGILAGATVSNMTSKTSSKNKKRKDQGPLWFGPDRWIAVGSTSGIVNVYDRSTLFTTSPTSSVLSPFSDPSNSKDTQIHPTNSPAKPLKTLDQLTTPISHLTFSPCGQLLAMSSRWKKDALRLIHMPTCTVYRNWPTSKTPLGRISAVALGEYEVEMGGDKRIVLVVGNEKGALRGWEIGG